MRVSYVPSASLLLLSSLSELSRCAVLAGGVEIAARQQQNKEYLDRAQATRTVAVGDPIARLARPDSCTGALPAAGEQACPVGQSDYLLFQGGDDVQVDSKPTKSLYRRQEEDGEPAQTSRSVPNVPQTAPNGGMSVTQPPATAQATFIKIAPDNFITFGWTFTDVIVTPEYLTIQAYCSQNGFTYPVGPTQGIAGDSTAFAWNPYEYEQGEGATPLAEASYTLRVYDERGYAAAPQAGYMRSYTGTVFSLYRPAKYVGLNDGWVCAACSAAVRNMPIHPAVVFTALSFFAGTWLVFSRAH